MNYIFKLEDTESKKVAKEKACADRLEKKILEMNILKEEKQQLKNQIDCLQVSLQNSKSAVKCLNKEVNENKRKHEKVREHANKNHKSEIKSWKKEFGMEKSQRIKAEKKLAIILFSDLNFATEASPSTYLPGHSRTCQL